MKRLNFKINLVVLRTYICTMINLDSIVALSTPQGIGAIGVIRLSGSHAIEIVGKHLTKGVERLNANTVHFSSFKIDDIVLDEVVATIFKSPKSYTGEDIVELSFHGSSYILNQALNALIASGAILAAPGEFTQRAFLNGKLDLSQAEAVADVIASNSSASHQLAIQQMRGGITNELKDLRTKLLDFAALIELELDFSGEDVEFADRTKFKELVVTISSVLKKLIDSFSFGNAMKNGIPVAIIGEPNVGKSTLLNSLFNEEKAIVSEIAGTTRDAIEDELIIEGVAFRFIDTAGIRHTNDIVESIGIKKTFEKAENAQLLIFLIDSNKFVGSKSSFLEEIKIIKNRFPNKRLLLIANKIDSLPEKQRKEITTSVKDILLLSAKEKIGITTLHKELTSLVNRGALSNNETIVTNSRHFEALNNALNAINSVQEGIDLKISTDLFSIDIRECLRHLGNITGEYDVDKDILGHIFSNFCIGK